MLFGKLSDDAQVTPAAACIHPSVFVSFIVIAAHSLPKANQTAGP